MREKDAEGPRIPNRLAIKAWKKRISAAALLFIENLEKGWEPPLIQGVKNANTMCGLCGRNVPY
jgi:hypothetical protein